MAQTFTSSDRKKFLTLGQRFPHSTHKNIAVRKGGQRFADATDKRASERTRRWFCHSEILVCKSNPVRILLRELFTASSAGVRSEARVGSCVGKIADPLPDYDILVS